MLAIHEEGKAAAEAEYTRLPELSILRNGAASTTVDQSVANSWNGVGVEHEDAERVVLAG